MNTPGSPADVACECPGRGIVLLSLLVALAGVAGSLWLSLGMGLKACTLCFYQRAFAFTAAGTLALALGTRVGRERALALAAAALAATGGLVVAGFHVSLEWSKKLECPKGIADLGTAPIQSAAMFVLLLGCLVAGSRGPYLKRFAFAVVLGALAGYGSVVANPPLAKAPAAAYPDPLITCRPPFVPAP